MTFVAMVEDVAASGLAICVIGLGVERIVGFWACQVVFFPGNSIGMIDMVFALHSKSITKIEQFALQLLISGV